MPSIRTAKLAATSSDSGVEKGYSLLGALRTKGKSRASATQEDDSARRRFIIVAIPGPIRISVQIKPENVPRIAYITTEHHVDRGIDVEH